MSAQQQYDQYGQGIDRHRKSHIHTILPTASRISPPTPYYGDTRTQYGAYDPRYPYGHPSSSQQNGRVASQPHTSSSDSNYYAYSQQHQQQASYDTSAYAAADQYSRMQVRDAAPSESAAPAHDWQQGSQAPSYPQVDPNYRSERSRHFSQDTNHSRPSQQYPHTYSHSQAGNTSRQPSYARAHDSQSASYSNSHSQSVVAPAKVARHKRSVPLACRRSNNIRQIAMTRLVAPSHLQPVASSVYILTMPARRSSTRASLLHRHLPIHMLATQRRPLLEPNPENRHPKGNHFHTRLQSGPVDLCLLLLRPSCRNHLPHAVQACIADPPTR